MPETTTIAIVAVQAPVTEVTLLEDRAQVVRTGTVKTVAGRNRYRIADVAPVICDKTLLVRLPDGSVRLNDVRVRRSQRILPVDKPADHAALNKRIEDLQARDVEKQNEATRLGDRLSMLETILDQTLHDVAVDAAWARPPAKTLPDRLTGLEDEMAAAVRRGLEVERERQDLAEQISDLQRQFQLTMTPSTRRGADIELELLADGAGETTFTVEYLVPGACWRPYHRARLEGQRVHFETEGCVWQNTGEDWTDVQLYFSTERPSLGTEVPLLSDDFLHKRDKAREDVVEMRQQKIETAGLGRPSSGKAVAPEVPGIDDGGAVQQLQAAARATVPSDGRPHRVPLDAFSADGAPGLRLLAELSTAVHLRTEQANGSKHPILAGPVDLSRDGGFVGRTKTLFVAPGETFELGWGPDPALRCWRIVYRDEKERSFMASWNTIEHRVVVKLSNVGPDERHFEVRERVPVSEIDKVKIRVNDQKTTGKPQGPDDDGILRWQVKLPPFGHQTLELHYVIEKHKDVKGL